MIGLQLVKAIARVSLVVTMGAFAGQACGGGGSKAMSAADVKTACGDWSAWECKGFGVICGATCTANDDVQIGCKGSGCERKGGPFSTEQCKGVALDGLQGCDRCKAAVAAGCL